MIQMPCVEPVFRPPSEAQSLILQVTNGCSWNNCTFCEMYTQPQKKFNFKSLEQIKQELVTVAATGYQPRRFFLADGDAMTLSYRRLFEIMRAIRECFPNLQRVSSYCLPRNLLSKTVDELQQLEALGLSLFYVGCESGDDLVLEKVNKGENFESSLAALKKIKQAGAKSSVMILNGMGGKLYSQQHALNSAKLMNAAQPEYLSTLVISFPMGVERYQQGFAGEFEQLEQVALFKEMYTLLEALELESTIFRSDHASNYLSLKGVLGKDKKSLLALLKKAIHAPETVSLRPEWLRGL